MQAPAPMADKEVHDAAFSPDYVMDGSIFVATGSGVFRSTNRGASWSPAVSGLTNLTVYRVALSPDYSADGTVFAGTDGGVFRSVNGGGSWTVINSGLTAMDVRASGVLSCLCLGSDRLCGHQQQGHLPQHRRRQLWSLIMSGHTPQRDVWSIAISPNFAVDNTLFTGCPSWQGFKSTDRGNTWAMTSSISTTLTREAGFSLTCGRWRCHPDLRQTARCSWVCSVAVCCGRRMAEQLANCADRHMAARVMVLGGAAGPDGEPVAFVGMNGGGVFVSTDRGASWHNRNAHNFFLMDTYALAVSPNYANDYTLFAGKILAGPWPVAMASADLRTVE